MGDWISVKDALPEKSQQIIACNNKGVVFAGFWNDKTREYKLPEVVIDRRSKKFTYWMPLPKAPVNG